MMGIITDLITDKIIDVRNIESVMEDIWNEGFDAASAFYDRAIDEMHRALHPDQSFSYRKCFESPCKDID